MKATDRFPCTARWLAMTVAGWLLGSALCLAQPAGNKVTVADVIPVGNSRMPTQRVTALLKTRPGAPYNQATLDDDVRELLKTRAFSNVEVRLQDAGQGRVVVYFQLTEHPNTIQEIRYEGAKHIKKEDLDEVTGLRVGMALNPVANQVAARAIERKYVVEKGRMFAKVELLEGGKAGDTRVVFGVTEGPPVKVSSIDFTGINFVYEGRVRTQIQSSTALLNMIGGEYNPQMVEADVQKLVEYYKTFGFHDVRVTRELQWESDLSRVKLVFHVHEGQRYRLGDLQLDGPKDVPKDRLMAAVRGKNGEFYDGNLMQANVEALKALRGYDGIETTVRKELLYKENGVVDVRYEMQERPPARVGEIIVVGNDVTRQNVILRQVPLYPGQILTYPDLRVGERNLARLNIFEANQEQGVRPTIEVLDPDGPNPVKDILVSVQEAKTGSLLFGLGVNSDAGLNGSVVLNERNFDILRFPSSFDDLLSGRAFRGAGQEFRAEAVPGTQFNRYTVSFREPFLFDSPNSLGLSGYYYTRAFNEYNERRFGFRGTLGRRLNELWSASGTVRVEEVTVKDVYPFAPAAILDDQGSHFLVGLKASAQRDTRDSFLRPTEGSMVEVSAEYVLGDYNFPILSLEANKYFTMYQRPDGSGRWVLALRSQFSWAGEEAPVFERFFAGGYRSLRGFEFRGVGPSDNGFMVGGRFMFLNSAEVQIPILQNDQLYAVGFVDSGTVDTDTSLANYRVTAGGGLRIVVPMLGPVPIALDFGFPIVQEPTDRKQVFSFWLGFFN